MRGITKKQAQEREVKLTGRLPLRLPDVPRDVLERFPSLVTFWGNGMEGWHEELKRALLANLTTLEDAHAASLEARTSISEQLAALQAAFDALDLADCTDAEQDIVALSALLAQHIAATQVHGSNGDVAGLDDIPVSTDGVTLEEVFYYG